MTSWFYGDLLHVAKTGLIFEKKLKNNFYLLLFSCLTSSTVVSFEIGQLHLIKENKTWNSFHMLLLSFCFVVFFTYQSHLTPKIHTCRQALNNHLARITVSRFLERRIDLPMDWLDYFHQEGFIIYVWQRPK